MSVEPEYQEAGAIVPVHARPIAVPVPRYFQDISPAEQVAYAVEVADALKPIIQQKGLSHRLNKKNPDDEYVELEAWQTCGKLCGMSAKIEWCRQIEGGFEARAVVIRVDTGLEIGSGESRCTRSEYNWKTRDDYALSGMAQTRAQSRALRGQLAWILVLAGYKPTPSEEMPPEGLQAPLPPPKPVPPRTPRAASPSEAGKPVPSPAAEASHSGATIAEDPVLKGKALDALANLRRERFISPALLQALLLEMVPHRKSEKTGTVSEGDLTIPELREVYGELQRRTKFVEGKPVGGGRVDLGETMFDGLEDEIPL